MLSVGEWRLMNPARIFVSHTPEDDDFCQDLVSALRATGSDVWVNDQHYALSQLLPVIEPEVRARPVFIVILSPAALRSGTVAAACTWAATYLCHDPNRRFLPVLAQPVDDTALRAFFEGFHTQPTMPIIGILPRAQAIHATLRTLALLPTVEALPPPQPMAYTPSMGQMPPAGPTGQIGQIGQMPPTGQMDSSYNVPYGAQSNPPNGPPSGPGPQSGPSLLQT